MSLPLRGGYPTVYNLTVNAGTPTVCQFTGETNYLQVRASGGGTLAFDSAQGKSIALASAQPGTTSWQGPAKTAAILLNSTSGTITVEVVAFLIS